MDFGPKNLKVIVLGGSGAVGRELIEELNINKDISEVVVLTRR